MLLQSPREIESRIQEIKQLLTTDLNPRKRAELQTELTWQEHKLSLINRG